MGKEIKPQDNFYDYVNKEWTDTAELPAGYSSWGSFEKLSKKSVDDINNLIDDLKSNVNTLTDNQQKIIKIYNNYLNFEKRNEHGFNPIKDIIAEVDNLKNKSDFTDFLITMNKKYCISFFHSKSIDSDFKDSNLRALLINSMGLGMSDRDFYDQTHPRHKEIKKAYEKYVVDLTKKANVKFNNPNLFELIYNFEDELSKSMLKQEELRDVEKIYNVVSINDLTGYCSFIDWQSYLEVLGYNKAKKIILFEPNFFIKLNEVLNKLSLEDLKDLILFDIIDAYTGVLSFDLEQLVFDYKSVFSGVKEMKPEKERAVSFANSLVGELIGQEYIKKHFSHEAKTDVLKIVDDLIAVYKTRISNLTWMSDITKQKAIEKLSSFTVKIGYPDKFEDFSSIEIKSYTEGGSLLENILNIVKHFKQKDLNELNLPVDKTEWYMDPQTVNAYYNPSSNEICFPAGILQAPFYDIKQSHAKNLGGIGAVIGHEVSHGFDDEGSKFDKNGNLENWWTDEDYKQYQQRTQKIVEQYSQYEINGTKVNGKLTLGENIGDLGGLSAALDICLNQSPNDVKEFFENYAFVWRRISTPEKINTSLLLDPHSPEEFRCNGVLVNIDKFHEVYKTKPGDNMYKPKEERIKIW